MKLNVGCGPHYADGWHNTDLVHVDGVITPDDIVTADDPFPFGTDQFERAYCGHVLEHVPWPAIPAWLAKLALVLASDAPVMFVGPDAVRTLDRWKRGEEDWHKVSAVIEGVGAYYPQTATWSGGYIFPGWEGDRHQWNCTEARVVDLLTECGWRDVTAVPLVDGELLDRDAILGDGWPLVDNSPCQFAVSAVRP